MPGVPGEWATSHEGPGHALPPSAKPFPTSKSRAESTDPARHTHCPGERPRPSGSQDERSGVPSPKCEATSSWEIHPRAQKHRCTSTLPLVSTLSSAPAQGRPNNPTTSPTCRCPPDSWPGLPHQVAPETPALSARPTFPPAQALGALLQPLAPSTDILESALISLEGAAQPPRQASQAGRMAEPWRQAPPPPPPPAHGQEGKFGSGDREPGPARPTPLPRPRVLGEGGTGISAGSKGAWSVSHLGCPVGSGHPQNSGPQARTSVPFLPPQSPQPP